MAFSFGLSICSLKMRYSPFFRKKTPQFLKTFFVILLILITSRLNLSSPSIPSSVKTLSLDGHLEFVHVDEAARDFGNISSVRPRAILYPGSVHDVASIVRFVWTLGAPLDIRIAAIGNGHSLRGQAQVDKGIVINMQSLRSQGMKVHVGDDTYMDVPGGELWINVLNESLKYGLTPKSWTDYLYLTVGGTLSNAGISGQAFRNGPQISNVHQLEVITGKGEIITCSGEQNSDLFYAVLGGLGQFGIITRARISLETARTMVKWIRVIYSDFSKFAKDQEYLISAENTFDYIEGFVVVNSTGFLDNWGSTFSPGDPVEATQSASDGRPLFCLELAKYFNRAENGMINKEVEKLLANLSYIPSTLSLAQASYAEFLDRVHVSEEKLKAQGLWDVPHPWLNLLVPKSKIYNFADHVFGRVLKNNRNGPILIYPVNKSKWDSRTSAVIPEEDIFYLVAFLSAAVPSSERNVVEHMLDQNTRILEYCEEAQLGVKQYLPHHTSLQEWQAHFGSRWELFVKRKRAYDPLAILAPGQGIIQKPNLF